MQRALLLAVGSVLALGAIALLVKLEDGASVLHEVASESSSRVGAREQRERLTSPTELDPSGERLAVADETVASSRVLRISSAHGLLVDRIQFRLEAEPQWSEARVDGEGLWSRPDSSPYEVRIPGHLPRSVPPEAREVALDADALFTLCAPGLREAIAAWDVGAPWLREELGDLFVDAITAGFVGSDELVLAMDTRAEGFARTGGAIDLQCHLHPSIAIRIDLQPYEGMRERHCVEEHAGWGEPLERRDLEVIVARPQAASDCVVELWSIDRSQGERTRTDTLGAYGTCTTFPIETLRSGMLAGGEARLRFSKVPIGGRLAATGVDLGTGDHGRTIFEHTGPPQRLSLSGGVQLVGRVVCDQGCADASLGLSAALIVTEDGSATPWSADGIPLDLDADGQFRWPVPTKVPRLERFGLPMPREIEVRFSVDGHDAIRRVVELPESGELRLEDLRFQERWVTWRLAASEIDNPRALHYQRLWRSDDPGISYELWRARTADAGWVQFALSPSDASDERVICRNQYGEETTRTWSGEPAPHTLVSMPDGGAIGLEHAGGGDYRAVKHRDCDVEFSWSDAAVREGRWIVWGIEWSGIRVQLGEERPGLGSNPRRKTIRIPAVGVQTWFEDHHPTGFSSEFSGWVTTGEPIRFSVD